MSETEQLDILRAQADIAMLKQATNGVRIIHTVIEENADTFGDSVREWRGWVRLDYVDSSGAIAQTNIPMAFLATFDGRLIACAPGPTGSPLLDIR